MDAGQQATASVGVVGCGLVCNFHSRMHASYGALVIRVHCRIIKFCASGTCACQFILP